MIARLVVVAAGVVAAAAGAATWAKRRTKPQNRTAGKTRNKRPREAGQNEDRQTKARQPKADSDAEAGSATGAGADDLQAIKGIGGVSEQRLSAADVTSFAQIAAWSPSDIDRIATQIKVSAERIKREDWVGQARTLSE